MSAPHPKLKAARFRAQALIRVRDFFSERGVLEVETPLLNRSASQDFHIDVFPVADGREQAPRFLQTSPEPHMKRMLARGYPDIYQVCKVFRQGECGRKHHPEFTMIEWYRLDFSTPQIMEEAAQLCRCIAGDRAAVFRSYQNAFLAAAGIDPLTATRETLWAHPAIRDAELSPESLRSRADALDFLMAAVVEPALDPQALTVVHDFPAELSAQALINPDIPGTAHRFELFSGGMELGNGYLELRDPVEYRRSFQAENRKRGENGKPEIPIDPDFFSDLAGALPPCAGVALGLDRLLMLGLGAASIDEVLEFPWGVASASAGAD